MKRKCTRHLRILLCIAAVATAIVVHPTRYSPLYLYTQDWETELCTIADTAFIYKVVEKNMPGATPVLGNIGNPGKRGQCDTLYVISK